MAIALRVSTDTVPLIPLGGLCRIVGGGTPSKKEPAYYKGTIPWVTVKDFTEFNLVDTVDHITDEAVCVSATNVIPAGTVLVVTRVGLGKVAMITCGMAINQDIKALFPDDRLQPEFLFWFLLSQADEIERMGAGATVKGITLPQLKSLSVPVPSLQEQRRITDILKRADGIRRRRNQAQDIARQLIPALFIDMFGDPFTNPMGWPEKSLGELVSLHGGGTPSKKNTEYWEGAIPWVSPKDMKPDCISDTIDHITQKALEETTIKWIPAESVLIVVRGMILVHTVPIRVNSSRVTINQDMKALVPNEKLFVNYLRWALQSMHSHVLSQVSISAHGTRKLDTNRLLALCIPLSPLSMQKEFESRLHRIQSILLQQEVAKNSAESSFQSLLHHAFNDLLSNETKAM